MNPEEICVSLSIAKKLKEAGWTQDTVFVWVEGREEGVKLWLEDDYLQASHFAHDCYPAPTAGEIEPNDKFSVDEYAAKDLKGKWGVWGIDKWNDTYNVGEPYDREVEARAAAWLKLKEEK